MTRPLCRNCGRTIRRVFRDVSFGEQHVARYRHHQSFSEFPDSIEEVKRLTGVQTVLSITWVTDAERWIKKAIVWDGASFTTRTSAARAAPCSSAAIRPRSARPPIHTPRRCSESASS